MRFFKKDKPSRALAHKLFSQNKFEKALIEYLIIFQVNPNDVNTAITISDIYHKLKKNELAIDYLEKAADYYSQQGFLRKAEAIYNKINRNNPDSIRGRKGLFNLYLTQKDEVTLESSRKTLNDKALRELHLMAQIQEKHQSESQVINSYQTILDMDPYNIRACLKLSSVLYKRNKQAEAIQILATMTGNLISSRNLNDASKIIAIAEKLDSNNLTIQCLKARLIIVGGEFEKGIILLHTLLKKHPNNLDILNSLGKAYIKIDKIGDAQKYFLRLFELDKSQSLELEKTAKKFLEQGNIESGFQTLQPMLSYYCQIKGNEYVIKLLLNITTYDHNHIPTLQALFHLFKEESDFPSALLYKEKIINHFLGHENIAQALIEIKDLLAIDPTNLYWHEKQDLLQKSNEKLETPVKIVDPISIELNHEPEDLPEIVRIDNIIRDELKSTEGLPGKELFTDRLSQAIKQAQRSGKKVGLMYLKLNRDRWDDRIKETYQNRNFIFDVTVRIVPFIRETDTLGYLGDDLFVLVLQEISTPENLEHIATKIQQQCFGLPLEIENDSFHMDASIGIALFPEDGKTAGDLQKNAKNAMRLSVEHGENSFVFFAKKMNEEAARRWDIRKDLRKALTQNELLLYFQPIVKIDTQESKTIGLEILLRWQHPELGLLFPGEFMGLVDEMDLIGDLTEWVLNDLMSRIRLWEEANLKLPLLSLNVNSLQIQNKAFSESIEKLIVKNSSKNNPLKLILEGQESTILGPKNYKKLQKLRELGVLLAIDQFGEGATSLVKLQGSPVDIIKIDPMFIEKSVNDESMAKLIRAIIIMANTFNIDVIAKGVEDDRQLSFLRSVGCIYAQGFYFSKPLPEEEVVENFLTIFDDQTKNTSESPLPSTVTKQNSKTAPVKTNQWDAPSFSLALKAKCGEEDAEIAEKLLNWSHDIMPNILWSKGTAIGGFIPRLNHKKKTHQIFKVWTKGTIEIQFQYLKSKSPPFNKKANRLELMTRFNKIPGFNLSLKMLDKRPSVSISLLRNADAYNQFLETIDWAILEILGTEKDV